MHNGMAPPLVISDFQNFNLEISKYGKIQFLFQLPTDSYFVLFLAITVEIMSNIGRSTLELQNSYHLTPFDLEDINPRS